MRGPSHLSSFICSANPSFLQLSPCPSHSTSRGQASAASPGDRGGNAQEEVTEERVLWGEASPEVPLKQRSRKWVSFWAKGASRWRT